MTPQERYNRDTQFRNMVDTMYVLINDAKFTPTEIREAAMLAQIHYEQIRPRPIYHGMDWVTGEPWRK